MGSAKNVRVGPGILYFGNVGATEPSDLSTAWDAAWIPVGYTEEGHAFSTEPSFEAIEVAEEKAPIAYYEGSRTYSVAFAMAEMTAENIQKALNGGTITTGTGIVTFEPPAGNAPATRVAIGWEADDKSERWVFRKAVNTGSTEIARKKGPDKATISVEFQLEKPDTGSIFKAIFANEA